MHSIHIKFVSEKDRVRGFYELAKNARISSLPDKIYQVPRDALKILEDAQISYRRATDDEVKLAHDQVRNPSPAVS